MQTGFSQTLCVCACDAFFYGQRHSIFIFFFKSLILTCIDILFFKVLFIIWICISIKTANDPPLVVEAWSKMSSGEVRQTAPGVCPSLMGGRRGPGCGVRSNQEGHFESRWRLTSSMKSHGFHGEQPRLGGDNIPTIRRRLQRVQSQQGHSESDQIRPK